MTSSTERRRRPRLPKPQPYTVQIESAKALTSELTDSLVTHFTKPYMDRAHEIARELGAIGDEEFVSATSESGNVAMVLRERFEKIAGKFYGSLKAFEEATSRNDSTIRDARAGLIDSVNITGAKLREAFADIVKHDDLLHNMSEGEVNDMLGEGKRRVAKWSEDIIKITHTWHALRR